MASLKYAVDIDTKGARSGLTALEQQIVGLGSILASSFAVGQIVKFGDSIIGLQNKLRSLTSDQNLVKTMFADITNIASEARAPLQETGDLYFRIARAAKDLGITQQQTTDITESLAKSLSMTGMTAQESSGALLQLGQALQSGRFQGDELRSVLENMPIVASAMAKELNTTVGGLRKLGSEGKITSDIFVRAMEKNKKAIDDAFGRSMITGEQIMNNLKTATAMAFTDMGNSIGISNKELKEFFGDVKTLSNTIKQLTIVITAFGTAWLIFAKILPGIRLGMNALEAVLKSSTGLFGIFGKNIKTIGTSLKTLTMALFSTSGGTGKIIEAFKGSLTVGIRFRQVLFSLTSILASVLRLGLRFAGWVGVFIAVAQAVDFFTQKFFKFSVVDWAWDKVSWLWNKLKDFYNWIQDKTPGQAALEGIMAKPLSEVVGDYYAQKGTGQNGVFGNGKVNAPSGGGGADKTKQQLKELQEVKKAIDEITVSYREQAKLRLNDLFFAKQSLNMSDDQVELAQQNNDILKEQDAALKDLANKEKDVLTNTNLSAKGRIEALAAIKKQKDEIVRATAEELAEAEKLLTATQATRLEQEKILNTMHLKQQANENAKVLGDLEDQIRLVGLWGDKLEDASTILDNQNELEAKHVEFANKKLELEANRKKLGEERFAQEMSNLQDEMTQTDQFYAAKLAGEQQLLKLQRDRARYDIKGSIGKKLEELARSVDPAVTAVQGLESVFSNMSSALDDFVETGKFKFGDFARSVINDLIKIALKASATKILGSIFGGLFGLKIPGFASGGQVGANKPIMVGEKGPELFVPNSAGTIVPNNKLGGNMSGSVGGPVTNNYITNNITAMDSKSVAQVFMENRKSLLGASTIARKELPYMQ